MRLLYIGQSSGTSKMRQKVLKKLLPNYSIQIIDINVPVEQTNIILRSLGCRFKTGPLIENVSNYIAKRIGLDYDLVWIDKAVFVTPEVIGKIKRKTDLLIHFTPDPAFIYHRSGHFVKSLPFFDYCITTKDYEVDYYYKFGAKKVILTSQGYDPAVHHPFHDFEEKKGVCFIGHYEKERGLAIESLINDGIIVKLAGIKWEKFSQKFKNNPNLIYLGTGLFGSKYARTISGSLMGLGFLSKWIPENITTRTIEIPACGTVLVTEKTPQIQSIFKENGAIYFDNINDMKDKISFYLEHKEKLQKIGSNGFVSVRNKFDYETIIKNCLEQIGLF